MSWGAKNQNLPFTGAFVVSYGFFSVKIKQVWYLGEACKFIKSANTFHEPFLTVVTVPAVLLGIALGPLAAKFLDAQRWGSGADGQKEAITLVGRLWYK